LDTLLKLADVKGVDRKTSLLHFVLDQLLKDSDSLASLSSQLKSVRPAANLQVPSLPPHNFLLSLEQALLHGMQPLTNRAQTSKGSSKTRKGGIL